MKMEVITQPNCGDTYLRIGRRDVVKSQEIATVRILSTSYPKLHFTS